MASQSFVSVINTHQSCCKSFCWGRRGGQLFCILLSTPPSQKESLNLPLSFSAGSTLLLLLLHLHHFPAVRIFFVGIHLLCCHGTAEERASERRRKGDEGIIKSVYSTSCQPSASLWDVRIHSSRYRGGGVGDSCLLTSGRLPQIKRGGNNEERDVEISPPESVTVSRKLIDS